MDSHSATCVTLACQDTLDAGVGAQFVRMWIDLLRRFGGFPVFILVNSTLPRLQDNERLVTRRCDMENFSQIPPRAHCGMALPTPNCLQGSLPSPS